jgi:hypothetical protein
VLHQLFWKKKSDSNPLGVPLGDLLLMLQPTSIKASLEGSTLVARHEHVETATLRHLIPLFQRGYVLVLYR